MLERGNVCGSCVRGGEQAMPLELPPIAVDTVHHQVNLNFPVFFCNLYTVCV